MPLIGEGLLVNWSDVEVKHRPDYYAWHFREHMVGRIELPGFNRGRRYIAEKASRDFFQFYELDDAAVLKSAPYLALAAEHGQHPKVVNNVRIVVNLQLSLGIGEGSSLLTLRFDAKPSGEAGLRDYLTRAALPASLDMPLVAAAHLATAHETPNQPQWVVMVEGLSSDAVVAAGEVNLGDLALREQGVTGPIVRDVFQHEFTITKMDIGKA